MAPSGETNPADRGRWQCPQHCTISKTLGDLLATLADVAPSLRSGDMDAMVHTVTVYRIRHQITGHILTCEQHPSYSDALRRCRELDQGHGYLRPVRVPEKDA